MSNNIDPAVDKTRSRAGDFERAGQEKPLSLWREFSLFIVENKAWWLVPIVLVLGCAGVLVFFASTGIAPFIYTLF